MNTSIELINRATGHAVTLQARGNLTLDLPQPSVVLVHAPVDQVQRYDRTGDDLLIYLQDGTVIRCDGYFHLDENQHHSELVLQDDSAALIHISFADVAQFNPEQRVPLQPQAEVLESVDPLLFGSDDFSGYGLLGLVGAGVGGALLGAGLDSGGGGGHTRTEVVDNTLPAEIAQPSFIVTDNQGQVQTLLMTGSTTDDMTPTFSGSGQVGATIQILKADGGMLGNTQVGSQGTWSVTLADQTQGPHRYEVVQLSAGSRISAGTIDLDILNSNVTLTIDPLNGDHQLNDSDLAAPISLGGSAIGLDVGTEITLTIKGLDYITQVAPGGTWSLELPADVAAGLADGFYTAQVSARDAAGNRYSAEENFIVDTSAPVVSINVIALDDLLNATEVTTAQTISGSVTGAATGEIVTINVAGMEYNALLSSDSTWAVDIPGAVWTALGDGALIVVASVTDAAGNTGEASRAIAIAAGLPGLRVATVAGDDVINAIEHNHDLAIFGTSTGLAKGQHVTVTVNGQRYLTAIDADGTWQVGLHAGDVAEFAQGALDIRVTSSDSSGDEVAIDHQVLVDLNETAVSINAVAVDNMINRVEQGSDILLSGATANIEAGQTVLVQFAGHQYQAEVAVDGSWEVDVPATDLAGLVDGYQTVKVQVTNAQGSVARSAQLVEIDLTAPLLVIEPTSSMGSLSAAQDDLLNAAELDQDLRVSGVASAEVGQALIVSLNGKNYQTEVGEGGEWSVTIAAGDLSSATDGPLILTAVTTDKAGNSTRQTRGLTVDTMAPVISLDTVAGDDILNALELGQALPVSGHASGLDGGEVLTISLNGQEYTTAVNADGGWSLVIAPDDLAALADGHYSLDASLADAAGNPAVASKSIDVLSVLPTLSVDVIAGDNVINSSERNAPVTISGSSTGLDVGSTVTASLNGKAYHASVAADGTWSSAITPGDLVDVRDGQYRLSVSATDAIGNPARTDKTLVIGTLNALLTIDPVAVDDRVNADEAAAGVTISGSVFNVEAGQEVTLSLSGTDYTATVNDDSSWSLDLPDSVWASLAEGALTLDAQVASVAGNNAYVSRAISLDTTPPRLTIEPVAGDDVIGGAEQHVEQVISGSAEVEPGQVVDITFNGRTYQSSVADDGSWRVVVASRDFLGSSDGSYVITATAVDKAGNRGSTSSTVLFDAEAPSVTLDSFTADDVLSRHEQGAVQVISGTASVAPGTEVAVTLNGKDYQASVQSDHSWSLLLGTADLAALADAGVYRIGASATDALGNVGSSERSFSVDLTGPLPTLTIDSISLDSGLSSNDFITNDMTLAIKGRLGAELAAGERAQISLDDGATWIDVAVSGRVWTYTDNRMLTDGDHNYQARLIDAVGNLGATVSQLVTIDTQAPGATITIIGISDDSGRYQDFITNDNSLTLHGALSNPLAADQMAQISLDGGANWTALGIAGTTWSYVDGRTLSEGAHVYAVRVVDAAGNIGSTDTQSVYVDLSAPTTTIQIDSINEDTGISAADFTTRDNRLVVNGTLSALLNADEVAQISVNGGADWTQLSPMGLTWDYTDGRTLGDGVYTYQVRVIDVAGNPGPIAQRAVTLDLSAPSTLINFDRISDDSGLSANDFITRDTRITLSGTLSKALASDEYAQLSPDAGTTWITLGDVSGTHWNYEDPRVLSEGGHYYQVRVVDQAGNIGVVASQGVVVDTTAPLTQATISGYFDDQGGRQGNQSSYNITDDTAPLLQGTLDTALQSGEVLRIFENDLYLGLATVNGTRWTYVRSGLVDGGTYDYSAVVTDAAGNTRDGSDYWLGVDTSTPSPASFEYQQTSDATPVLRGALTTDFNNDQVLYVSVNGKTYSSDASQGDGRVVVDRANHTWYVQIPDSDALGVDYYDVTAKVVDVKGNGNINSQTFNGAQEVIAEPAINTAWAADAPFSRTANQHGLSYSITGDGLWSIVANTAVYNSSDLNSYNTAVLTKEVGTGNTVNYSYFDLDRDGGMDIFASQSNYVQPFQYWQNDNGHYTSKTIAYGALDSFYGGTVAYDRTGNGYLDLVLGDSNLDGNSAGWFINNQDGSFSHDSSSRFLTPNYTFGASISGVDINNDGTVDIVAQVSGAGALDYFALGVFNNAGDGSMSIGQVMSSVFSDGSGTENVGSSMTWADFNGDGQLDLYLNQHYLGANKAAVLINHGGTLDDFVEINAGPDIRSRIALAVDWDHNGTMDIAKLGGYTNGNIVQLILNSGDGLSWTNADLGYSYSSRLTGAAALDYDWDGAVDLLGFTADGHAFVVENTEAVAAGTSLHLRILDQNGINAFYGNTVQLFDTSGALVATQILNPQSGVGVNDSSGLLSFYGLSASETYSVKLIRIDEGVRSDVTEASHPSWGGLTAGDATHNYILSAQADGEISRGVFVGTGYNDTFVAALGVATHQGSGGWGCSSEHADWTAANGGMDVVDFKLATSGVTVDLSKTATQNTGFNSVELHDIEGLAGSHFADTFSASTADNQFQGREGDDHFNLDKGGHDSLIYTLLNAAGATGGNGSDSVDGFTVGTWEGTDDSDRIDVSELLHQAGYTGTGEASYVEGVATLDVSATDIDDYLQLVQKGGSSELRFDHDGAGTAFDSSTILTINEVQVDLATLLANHQLLVA
ncbi:Ig-like domain-containing protein [Pseudomonas sp. EL_65y_Pfl2_R95]|uniref:Ig-like domain-containing protein n=1 Tax=Pseudomonas sp. EL_65y_Pfl2_R95 TaxID=3088698 RepID=UPI0030D89956